MNWLAHIFISRNHIDYQLGNLLADPLKGRGWDGASSELREGLRMHGSIDAFTDVHELVSKSKSRLGVNGYLRGVVIDVAYDHLLLNNWHHYSKVSLERYINTFYRQAASVVDGYPGRARGFVNRVIATKNLTSYGTYKGLELAFRRIDTRLSERVLKRESTTDYLPLLKSEMQGIEEDFHAFFPELEAFVAAQLGQAT